MSGARLPHGRESSPPFSGSDRSFSYSYDSDSRSSSYSSASTDSSADSNVHRRHGRRRFRSRSPILGDVDRRPPRTEGVLQMDGGPVLPSFAVLPSVLGHIPVPPGRTTPSHVDTGVLSSPSDKPAGDWACGVCSNINSDQRDACFRCGCHFTESLLATPSFEVSVAQLPPGVSASTVEKAIRATLPDGCPVYVATDAKTFRPFVQFASVEEATKYLVGRRCELELADGARVQRTRLGFSPSPHPQQKQEDIAAETARATVEAARVKTESTLVAAGVPRFLWPATWNPPQTFPSVEKQKAFLGTMSAHWDHLSEEQRRYYESEVRKALLKAVSPVDVVATTAAKSGGTLASPAQSPAASVAAPPTVAASTATSSTPTTPPMTDSPQKTTGTTSHALDGLKKRLAERKLALKKSEAGVSAAAGVSQPTTPGTAASLAQKTTVTPGGVSSTSGSGDFPSAPSSGLTHMHSWGGFPVPLQYAELSSVPRSVELARVPMSVCERLLPPALLQVARAQFR